MFRKALSRGRQHLWKVFIKNQMSCLNGTMDRQLSEMIHQLPFDNLEKYAQLLTNWTFIKYMYVLL